MLAVAARTAVAFLVGALLSCDVHADSAPISNDFYSLTLRDNLSVCVQSKAGATFECSPTFTIIARDTDPKPANRPAGIAHASYNVVSWEVASAGVHQDKALKQVKVGEGVAGDGFDDSVLRGNAEGRTADLFSAGNTVVVTASGAEVNGASIQFRFDTTATFDLNAALTLNHDTREPVLELCFTPKQEGYYSVGYTGMPAYEPGMWEEIWQPLIWQEKRFPDRSYMTLAYRCTVPATMVRAEGQCVALVADPRELPFDPLPVMDNSRFGVAVRNARGQAQPMLFAPALGGQGSLMHAGEPFTFRMRLAATQGNCAAAYEMVARDIYGFADYRHNAIASLNGTLNNMLDYGMSQHSQFIEALKGCSYSTDVPGAVKNVSSLNPLEMALVTDNADIYQHRAYPLMEYMLSRKKSLFCLNRNQKIQSPSREMKGPCAPLTELTSLYDVFQRSNPVFLNLAEKMRGAERAHGEDSVDKGDPWRHSLALYRATGKKAYLADAMAGADAYVKRRIDRVQTDFNDPDAGDLFFWTGYAPKWIDLLELYEQSGERRYLDAAQAGARQFAMFVFMCPSIPDRDILVNKDGKAPMYWYLKGKGHKQMYCPEEEVPAWRLSEMGLTSESSGTSNGHRAIFMANYAPWLLRLGYYARDTFLTDIARSAVIGRYRNFPGYHINTARTTVYEKADYPLREHNELSANSFHYNHIWPMMSMLFDYLVTDVFVRSDGQISFPSEFIEGYAYLQNKFYGHLPGEWYGLKNVQIWMPRDVLQCDNVEVNYLTARRGNTLLCAFTNQSRDKVTATVALNRTLIGKLAGRKKVAKIRQENGAQEKCVVEDGAFTVSVKARGITAVEIRDVEIVPAFQSRILARKSRNSRSPDYLEVPFGGARVMVLPGVETDNAYLYLQSDDDEFSAITLHWQQGGSWNTVHDDAFPYEFTVPLDRAAAELRFYFEGVCVDGKTTRSTEAVLRHAKQ